MDKHVKDLMFTVPVTIHSTGLKDSMGGRTEGTSVDVKGYVYDEVVVITNYFGESETSTRQIYLPLDDVSQVNSSSLISCLDSVKSRIIRKQEYRGREGRTLIGVVYLP